jgi:hypothetical protein
MMDKIHEAVDLKCNIASSESYRIGPKFIGNTSNNKADR